MKILYYSPHPTHDIVSEVGYATHQREVINALQELGHTVISVIMGGTEKSTLSSAGIPSNSNSLKAKIKKIIPKFLWVSLKDFKLMQHDTKAAKALEKAIIEHQPDLVYERSEYLQNKGVKVIKKYNVKYFLEVNAPFIEEMKGFEGSSIWHQLAHKKEKNKCQNADKIIVVSSALKQFIIEKYNVLENKIFIQPNCINPNKIKVNNDNVEEIKNQYLLNGYKVIGFVGSILPHHGVDNLIEAFNLVFQKNNKTKLLIIGDGSIVAQLKKIIENLNLQRNVIFTGKVAHHLVFNYIKNMDICVMAKSNWYGSPIKIFEYAAMKKPVIAPNTLPVLDVMVNYENGIVTEINVESTANAIQYLLDNTDEANKMANKFQQQVLENYTWHNAAKLIIAEYNDIKIKEFKI